MICAGISSTDVFKTIVDNTYRDLQAKMRLTQWKKV